MRRIDFVVLLTRLFLGYLFLSSGLCKLTEGEFGQLIGPPLLIKSLTPYGLAGFGIFIATSQVVIGALILSQRFSLLGLVALVPINASMVAVTISQNWRGTPFVDAVFLLMNVLVLLYEWPTLKVFVLPEAPRSPVAPLTNQLFPNRWLPISVLLTAALSAIVARYDPEMTPIPAIACFGLTYVNVWKNPALLRLDRIVLGLSLLAILSVTLAKQLKSLQINAVLVFEFAVLACFFLVIVSVWQSRRQHIA
jgi:uncharacterized membrane protein YphA (DoxX/SURF4 family)